MRKSSRVAKPRTPMSESASPVSRQVLQDHTRLALAKINAVKWCVTVVATALSIPAVMLAITPALSSMAGKNTVVDIKIAMAFGITMTLTTTVSGAAFVIKMKEARRLAERNRRVEKDLMAAKAQLTAERARRKKAEKRCAMLGVDAIGGTASAEPPGK
jgi:hypothetical protein